MLLLSFDVSFKSMGSALQVTDSLGFSDVENTLASFSLFLIRRKVG